jgi:hypothetical protein
MSGQRIAELERDMAIVVRLLIDADSILRDSPELQERERLRERYLRTDADAASANDEPKSET